MKKLLSTLASVALLPGILFASEKAVIGLTEPIKEIDLAFPEIGVISHFAVEEGDSVSKGDLLAQLDTRIYEGRKKIAEMAANSEAEVRSSRAELKMYEERYSKLKGLGSRMTNPDELTRAEVALEGARSKHEIALDGAVKATIELEQILLEIDRRTLFSPISGVVTETFRDVAESVSGGETLVMKVVDLSELAIVVHINVALARELEVGDLVPVSPLDGGPDAMAVVNFISPVVDASSSTRRVRLLINNESNEHLSGVKYSVSLPQSVASR